MDLSKHPDLGIFVWIIKTNHLIFISVQTNLVCIRGATESWWYFLCSMLIIPCSLETMLGTYIEWERGYLVNLIWMTIEKLVMFLALSLGEIGRIKWLVFPSHLYWLDSFIVQYSKTPRMLITDYAWSISVNDQCWETHDKIERMTAVPYASVIGSLMSTMLCTRLGIYILL